MKHLCFTFVVFCCFLPKMLQAQRSANTFFIGTSAFVAASLVLDEENPHFYQVNLGYQLSTHQSISLEMITWRYHAPLGIPYGKSYGEKSENFPGYVSAQGAAIAYQYFWWGNFYSALHVAWMHQKYHDNSQTKVESGKQLFMTTRLVGYYFSFIKSGFFMEPSIAITHWPINSNLPHSFQEKEDKWPNYMMFEPGFHLGFNF